MHNNRTLTFVIFLIIIGCLFYLFRKIKIENFELIIAHQQNKSLFRVVDINNIANENTYDVFFIPSEYEIKFSQINYDIKAQSLINKDKTEAINLFSREETDKLSDIVNFKYIPPTEWIPLSFDSTDKNKDLFDFTNNIVLTKKYVTCDIETGQNQVITNYKLKTQEQFLTKIDLTTKTVKTTKIETEENAFNHNRQIISNEQQ